MLLILVLHTNNTEEEIRLIAGDNTLLLVTKLEFCVYLKRTAYTLIAINIIMQHNSAEQPDPVLQDTLVYADIGPSSFKKRAKHVVTLRPDDMDDRVEYALLNHSLQKPTIPTNHDSTAGKINIMHIENCL